MPVLRQSQLDGSTGILPVHEDLSGGNGRDMTLLRTMITAVLAVLACAAPAQTTNTLSNDRLPPSLLPGEEVTSLTLEPGIKGMVHKLPAAAAETTHILFYLLPNGNTIEQTFGRAEATGLDWHYYIQHVGAQSRRLVDLRPTERLVVIYLEAEGKSWPSWRSKRKEEGDRRIREVVETLAKEYGGADCPISLVSHSGGGSFMFGFINAHDKLPARVRLFGFLDSNYGFDAELHADKLLKWLTSNPAARLLVLAYDDRNITVNGKLVVSATGGTWRSSIRMASAMETTVPIQVRDNRDFITSTALEGRLELSAHRNAENKILHTVLVEKNGLVYTLTRDLPAAREEDFYGEQHYRKWVR